MGIVTACQNLTIMILPKSDDNHDDIGIYFRKYGTGKKLYKVDDEGPLIPMFFIFILSFKLSIIFSFYCEEYY